ncbi:MAG: CBS domain-containing protein [Enterococcus sp.]
MSVSDFMSQSLIVVAPETLIYDAIDLMKKHDIHRLPVVKHDQLVGLITEGLISAAMPSKATSLSVHEVHYLLNKTTVADVMEKQVQTIAPDDLLEEAIYKMRQYNIGVLPVLDEHADLVGIITNNDIFEAFLKITGYHEGGTRVTIQITDNHKGVLAHLTQLLAEHEFNITTIVVNPLALSTMIEMQISTQGAKELEKLLTAAGYLVIATVVTPEK